MCIVAAIAASTVAGAAISSSASRSAANKQQDAANRASDIQQQQFEQTRTDNLPALDARNAGLAGYQALLKDPSSVTQDPGYQFGLTQGQKAIDASASARGGLYSGATLKALQRYGQDYASTKYDASLARQSTLAGLGQPGSAGIASAGMNAANNISQNYLGVGNVQGANALNQGNIWGNAVNQIASSYGRSKTGDNGATWGTEAGNGSIYDWGTGWKN